MKGNMCSWWLVYFFLQFLCMMHIDVKCAPPFAQHTKKKLVEKLYFESLICSDSFSHILFFLQCQKVQTTGTFYRHCSEYFKVFPLYSLCYAVSNCLLCINQVPGDAICIPDLKNKVNNYFVFLYCTANLMIVGKSVILW